MVGKMVGKTHHSYLKNSNIRLLNT